MSIVSQYNALATTATSHSRSDEPSQNQNPEPKMTLGDSHSIQITTIRLNGANFPFWSQSAACMAKLAMTGDTKPPALHDHDWLSQLYHSMAPIICATQQPRNFGIMSMWCNLIWQQVLSVWTDLEAWRDQARRRKCDQVPQHFEEDMAYVISSAVSRQIAG